MAFPGGDRLEIRARRGFPAYGRLIFDTGTVVYNYGGLRGEWADGTPFEGIRYIDRFLIRDGRIVDQKVWNDLAVAIAARQAPR